MVSPREWMAPGARFQPTASSRAKADVGLVASSSAVASGPAPASITCCGTRSVPVKANRPGGSRSVPPPRAASASSAS